MTVVCMVLILNSYTVYCTSSCTRCYRVLITIKWQNYYLLHTCTIGGPTPGVLSVNTHLILVRDKVLEAASCWKDIGRGLPSITEGFISSTSGSDNECLYKVLSKWMHTGNAKISDLLNALEQPAVGRKDIANDIRALKGKPEGDKLGL